MLAFGERHKDTAAESVIPEGVISANAFRSPDETRARISSKTDDVIGIARIRFTSPGWYPA